VKGQQAYRDFSVVRSAHISLDMQAMPLHSFYDEYLP